MVEEIDQDDMPLSNCIEEPMEMGEIHAVEVGHAKSRPIPLGNGGRRNHFSPLTVRFNPGDCGSQSFPHCARHLFSSVGGPVQRVELRAGSRFDDHRIGAKRQSPRSDSFAFSDGSQQLRAGAVSPLHPFRPFHRNPEREEVT